MLANMVEPKDRKESSAILSEWLLEHLWQVVPCAVYRLQVAGGAFITAWVSDNIKRITGYAVEEVLAADWWTDHLHPEDKAAVLANRASLLYRDRLSHTYRIRCQQGGYLWVQDEAQVLHDAAGYPTGVIGSWTNITEHQQVAAALQQNKVLLDSIQQAEEALQASEKRYRTIFETATVSLWEEDYSAVKSALEALKAQGVADFRRYFEEHPEFVTEAARSIQVRNVNQATLALFGAQTKEAMTGSLWRIFTEESLRTFREALIAITEGKTYFEAETVNQTLQGQQVDILMTMRFPSATEEFQQVLICIVDITARKRAERALFEEKERIQVTLHSIGDAVITTDAAGIVQYMNPMAESLTGWPAAKAYGQPLVTVFHIINEETREPAPDPVACCLQEGRITGLAVHTSLLSRSGHEYAIQDSAAPIRGQGGEILGVVLVFSDVTEARRLSQAMSYQASHDALTGLINRREFEQRLRRALETARDGEIEHTLGYLDLDQFKIINDTCSHAAGDELLRQLSGLFKVRIRKRDSLARLGGDEFGVLMEHCSVQQAMRVADALRKMVENFRFLWEDKSFTIGVSIGLVSINKSSTDMAEVLSAADAACHMAKEQGRNRIHIYQDNDAELARRRGEMQWATRIPRALEENRFQLSFQPIAPLRGDGDEGEHYELLLRMQDETGRIVLPSAFLSSAERYNLAARLDRWVISTAFHWLTCHPARLERLSLCSINLSGHSLGDEAFLAFVIQQFAVTPIAPEKICFEITETIAIANLSYATHFIKVLKELGCRFALDDFGSGLCSFTYLRSLPVDFLKIDGAFVKDIVDDPMSLAMVKSINEIGQLMGKQTIAEFVENERILEKLREIGVNYVQGYFIGRPKLLE
jgi:diguanylate cyclase (GGDEF)-like protein/PAS domain S-box-containing protein